MREDFCAFILTHGRPDRVYTYETLRRCGYTGEIYLIVDDEDHALPQYQLRFGKDRVLIFSKAEIAKTFDEGDNFQDRRAIIYARNASFEFARQLERKYFIELDDDYKQFWHRFDARGYYVHIKIRDLDALLEAMVGFIAATPFLSIAMSQAGDHIGGGNSSYNKKIGTKRKAMNSFICSTERSFQFVGRINEDVNTYTSLQRRGGAFLTLYAAEVEQLPTQSNAGGMTDLYLDSGTYIKSFYSVMYAPSCAVVAPMRGNNATGVAAARIHHRIRWECAAPLILPERFRKRRPKAAA